jgi:dTMP kinase
MTGRFITFEGGEGSGKSTQLQLLAKAFRAANISYLTTREPGGTTGAEQIRTLLVTGKPDAWDPITETLLFYAARLDHVNKFIKPALTTGRMVLCDRFADSTLVYQGIGKNLSEIYIRELHQLTLGSFAPDLTLILDIDPTIGLKRAFERRGGDLFAQDPAKLEERFETMDIAFHRKVRAGFLSIAKREPERCALLDAAQEKNTLHKQIVDVINQRLGLSLRPHA